MTRPISVIIYKNRKVHVDLRDYGDTCGKHWIARWMRRAGL